MLCSGIEETLLILFDDLGCRINTSQFMHVFKIKQSSKIQQAIVHSTYRFFQDINQPIISDEILKKYGRIESTVKNYYQGLLEEHVNDENQII